MFIFVLEILILKGRSATVFACTDIHHLNRKLYLVKSLCCSHGAPYKFNFDVPTVLDESYQADVNFCTYFR